jgi:hypothetical protein
MWLCGDENISIISNIHIKLMYMTENKTEVIWDI